MVGCSTKPDIGNADMKLTGKPTGPKGLAGGPGPQKGSGPNTSNNAAKVAQPQ